MKSLVVLIFVASSLSFAETKTIPITGMTCGGCVAAIKKAVCTDLKYSKANCQVKIGELKVTADHVDMAAIESAVKEAGYEVASSTPAAATTEAQPAAATPTKKKK
jgi:copper chaperone CopZ